MKTLHRYLTRQVVASLLMTAAIFTAVLLLGNVLKNVLLLVVHREAGLGVILQAIGLLIPYVWAFALPMGLLTATLLVFGRFSADQELTAARAGGISLLSLATPILLLSLLLCGLCALINMEYAPRCWHAYKNLISEAKIRIEDIQFPEGRYITDLPGATNLTVYIGRNRDHQLEDVRVIVSEEGSLVTFRAPSGRIVRDESKKQIVLEMIDVSGIRVTGGDVTVMSYSMLPLQMPLPTPRSKRGPGLSEMTFWQLQREMRELEDRMRVPAVLDKTEPDAGGKLRMLEEQRKDITAPVRFRIHQQVAFSFASFGFALLGIPLGIRVHRRETNIGFFIALMLVAVYYAFMLLSKALAARPELAPHLIVWLPNFLFQAAGAVLLWRANRGV